MRFINSWFWVFSFGIVKMVQKLIQTSGSQTVLSLTRGSHMWDPRHATYGSGSNQTQHRLRLQEQRVLIITHPKPLIQHADRLQTAHQIIKRVVRMMVSAADKPANAVLLWEKNIVPWLISRANKFKRTRRKLGSQIGWLYSVISTLHSVSNDSARIQSKSLPLLQKQFVAMPPFLCRGGEPPLQMVAKWTALTNGFVGAAGVISRPYKWPDL